MAFCSICLDEIDFRIAGEEKHLAALPCTHVFHWACLNKWSPHTCPTCREPYGDKGMMRLRFEVHDDVAAKGKSGATAKKEEDKDYKEILEALDEAHSKIRFLEEEAMKAAPVHENSLQRTNLPHVNMETHKPVKPLRQLFAQSGSSRSFTESVSMSTRFGHLEQKPMLKRLGHPLSKPVFGGAASGHNAASRPHLASLAGRVSVKFRLGPRTKARHRGDVFSRLG